VEDSQLEDTFSVTNVEHAFIFAEREFTSETVANDYEFPLDNAIALDDEESEFADFNLDMYWIDTRITHEEKDYSYDSLYAIVNPTEEEETIEDKDEEETAF
jgi:hypothetical protein